MTMKEEQPAKSGFFTTMPGVLTAVAAIITAVGGVYGVYATQNKGDQPPPPPTTSPAAADDPTTPTPSEPTNVPIIIALGDLNGQESTDTSPIDEAFTAWYLSADLDRQTVADACGVGDVDSCTLLEQVLAQDCQDTFDAACDILYFVEPAGSELENLGATCGYYFEDWSFAGRCTT
jgi:hypothetical protein